MVASVNDVELLRMSSEGDESAYDELVVRHRSALLAFATELTDEQATADDLTAAGFEALRERAGEAELIGAVRPFLLMTAADLSGADFDLTAECRGWDPLDAPSQAVLWHTDIEADPTEFVALVSGVAVDELPAALEAARTAVGVPNGGDEALRARLTAYLLGPTASALAAAHSPTPAPVPAVAEDVAEDVEEEVEAPIADEAPDVEPEDELVDTEQDLDATGEVPVIAPADIEEDDLDATSEVPVVVAEVAPPPAMIAPPPMSPMPLPPMPPKPSFTPPAVEEPTQLVPAEHAAFVRPPPPAPSPATSPAAGQGTEQGNEPAMANGGPGVTPYAALDNEDTGPVPLIPPAKPVVYGSRTLTTVLAPVTAVAVVLLAVSLAGAAVLRDEPEAEFQQRNQGTTSKLNGPQETIRGQWLRKKPTPSESPSATESESPSESPSETPTETPTGLPSPSNGTSPDPSDTGPPSPTGSTPQEPTNSGTPTATPTETDTGTATPTDTSTPTFP